MKIFFVSLGCDKNLVDSEKMLGILSGRGYEFTDDEEDADIIIINTCCFIGDAKEESISEIIRLGELKKTGKLKCLIAGGCLAQRYMDEIFANLPELDAVIGTMSIGSIAEVLDEALGNISSGNADQKVSRAEALDVKPYSDMKRSLTTGGHYAYLKIAEGCNKRCTYCIIPYVRGSYRSIPMEDLLSEAEQLAMQGVKELILVAQETTLYGTDIYGHKCLPELLRKLCGIDGLKWIRILYAYPEEITDELIDTIASEDKICRYLDLPIQHISDEILRKMGRKTTRKSIEELIGKIRERIPGMCLRTTLISGFPGETREEFEELYRFVNETEFDRLGVFTYSAEEGTPAAQMQDQVPYDIAARRRDELMELQQAVTFDINETHVGEKLDVLIEGYLPEDGIYVGRTYRDAPGVDGLFFVKASRELMTGDMVRAEVTEANGYDLSGVMIDE
ncbi:MAG: 30S ribosomal protein S12 methylthiotransferase RimO [Lachnospiraceae bacterium]|nr:30S ribosomal protein S12 methylthiotransferase RimO [Lachnospiraceae bacterium]